MQIPIFFCYFNTTVLIPRNVIKVLKSFVKYWASKLAHYAFTSLPR